MNLQRITGFAAMATIALSLSASGAARADEHEKGHHAMYASCAKVCADCQLACEMNFHHCFTMVEAGKKEHAKAMHLSVDCAELCATSAKLTARHSPLAPAACEACAKACDVCGAECAKFPDMPEMKACADVCKKCAASCREMAKMAGHDHHEKK